MRTKLSSRELQLLSAYLDGELSKKDQKRVERLLSDHPAAISSLEKLRQVKSVIKLLPIHKVPRNFTISTEDVSRSLIPNLAGVLRYASAVSAVLLIVVIAFDFISSYQSAPVELGFARSNAEIMFEEKSIGSVEEEAPIIIWHPAAPPTGEGYGIGGGRGGDGDSDLQHEMLLPDVNIAPSDDQAEEVPSIAQEGITAETEQLPQVVGEQPQADAEKYDQESKSPEDESGPILGIRPSESQGMIEPFDEIPEAVIEVPETISLRLVEIVLAGLTISAALLAGFLRKRKK
jgi:hypothetical protein